MYQFLFIALLIFWNMAYGAYNDATNQKYTYIRCTRSLFFSFPDRTSQRPQKTTLCLANIALHCHEAVALQRAQTLVANQQPLDPADILKAHDTTRILLEGLIISQQTGEIPDDPAERANCYAYLVYMEQLFSIQHKR